MYIKTNAEASLAETSKSGPENLDTVCVCFSQESFVLHSISLHYS